MLGWKKHSWNQDCRLGGIGGKRRRGQQRMRWLDGITDLMDVPQNPACFLSPLCTGNQRDEWRVAGMGPGDPALGLSLSPCLCTQTTPWAGR